MAGKPTTNWRGRNRQLQGCGRGRTGADAGPTPSAALELSISPTERPKCCAAGRRVERRGLIIAARPRPQAVSPTTPWLARHLRPQCRVRLGSDAAPGPSTLRHSRARGRCVRLHQAALRVSKSRSWCRVSLQSLTLVNVRPSFAELPRSRARARLNNGASPWTTSSRRRFHQSARCLLACGTSTPVMPMRHRSAGPRAA